MFPFRREYVGGQLVGGHAGAPVGCRWWSKAAKHKSLLMLQRDTNWVFTRADQVFRE
ncbi:hypothetical protein GCM10010160_73040 [Acrocarpospora corrugata]